VFDWWQDENTLKQMILKQTKKTSYGKKPLMRLIDIKKVLEKSVNPHRYRSEQIFTRVTPDEKELLIKMAKKKDQKVADYVREKLFS